MKQAYNWTKWPITE